MSEIKIAADSGGGTVSLKGPATTTGNAAIQLTLPDVATGGSVVTADSSGNITATGTFYASNSVGRNLVINGDFSCAQRSTAAVSTSNGNNEGYQTVDRWRFYAGGAGVLNQQQVDLTAATDPDGFYKALKVDVTTVDSSIAAGDFINFQQNIEGFNWAQLNYGRSDAKSVTVSFWVKSTKTGIYTFSIRNGAADRSYIAEYTVSSSNTWEKKTITIPGDTSGTWLITNGIGARCCFNLMNGTDGTASANSWGAGNKWSTTNQVNFFDNTSNDFYITGVQIETGSTATEFEHKPYGQVLAECQRYYEGLHMNAGTAMWMAWPHGSGPAYKMEYSYKVTKRAVPTSQLEGNASWSGTTPLSFHSTNVAAFHHASTEYYLSDANLDLCYSFDAEL